MPPQTRRECRTCGAVVSRDARFCKRCGAPLTPAPVAAPVAAPETAERAQLPQPAPQSPAHYWATRGALGVLVGLTALAVLFALAVLLFGAFVE